MSASVSYSLLKAFFTLIQYEGHKWHFIEYPKSCVCVCVCVYTLVYILVYTMYIY